MKYEHTIGQVAKSAGCKVQTIRYYEQIGLLPAPIRSEGNQRLYTDHDIHRLSFIRHARALGFPLDAVRELISISNSPDHACDTADEIAAKQLTDVRARIERLQALEKELSRMLDHCTGGKASDCLVLETLSDHSLCVTEDHKNPS